MKDYVSLGPDIDKRLDVIISLLLKLIPKDKEKLTLREQVDLLRGLAVRPRDIANILGKTDSYVTKEIASLNRSATGPNRKRGKNGRSELRED